MRCDVKPHQNASCHLLEAAMHLLETTVQLGAALALLALNF